MNRSRSCGSLAGKLLRISGALALGLSASLSAGAGDGGGGPERGSSGVVVEEAGRGSAIEKAGIQAGDVLLSWRRPVGLPAVAGEARTDIESIFDWLSLVVEQAPRGALELAGERGGEPAVFEVPAGRWELEVRPRMAPPLLADYLEGRELVTAADPAGGTAVWRSIARRALEEEDRHLASWLHLKSGGAWAEARELDEALAAYQRAAAIARHPAARAAIADAVAASHRRHNEYAEAEASYRSSLEIRRQAGAEGLAVAQSLHDLGALARLRGQMDSAQEHLDRALGIRQRLAPGSLTVADSLSQLGNVAWQRGSIDLAEQRYQRVFEIRQRLDPDSLGMAAIINNLGLVASSRGDLDLSESYHQQAVAIHEELASDSLDLAKLLSNLGAVAWDRSELDRAAKYFRRALGIRERLAPESRDLAGSLNTLGAVAWRRGEIDLASAYFERCHAIQARLVPGSLKLASTLNTLGLVARRRGEYEVAGDYFGQALAIQEAIAPDSLHVAITLNNLGVIARLRGEVNLAEKHFRRSLEINRGVASGSLDVAIGLHNLGEVARQRNQLDIAVDHYSQALEIQQEKSPDGAAVAETLANLGIVAGDRGQLDLSEDYLQRALAIRERLAPGSLGVAKTLNHLGHSARARGEARLAASYFERSIEALEAQIGKLGGSHETQGGFRAIYGHYYRDLIKSLLSRSDFAQAFAVLERSRARSFLAMLAERDLVFSADLSEDLERARGRLAARHDRIRNRMAGLSPGQDEQKIEESLQDLRALYRERDEIAEKVRQASPQLAALQYPRPLDLAAARGALDPGTVMLSYSVGKERSELFVASRDSALDVHSLAIGEDQLRREVDLFRRLIHDARPGDDLGSVPMASLDGVGRRLYRALIGPAEERIARGRRLLLIPDGPLHLLPFAALVRETGEEAPAGGRHHRYLAEWKPLHSALSATVYAQLQATRPPRPGEQGGPPVLLAAFGDPRYSRDSGEEIADARLRSALGRVSDLQALPSSRREVEEIAGLYPPDARRIYLGAAATEERAKAAGSVRILHFATHGHLDPRFPLDSGLILSIPEEAGDGLDNGLDNGLLQAWEILESVRLNADLVVLSACASGLGKERGGEGLIGLTRAFQYAGARSVAASLWNVDDQGTAEMMVRFHRHLRAGLPKDEALRAAQVELIAGPVRVAGSDPQGVEIDATAPYYWAAFQIIGDWR